MPHVNRRFGYSYWDDWGRFVVEERNHFGQIQRKLETWDAYGNRLRETDIHGVLTVRKVDPMGRIFSEWNETGAWSRQELRSGPGATCPALATHRRVDTIAGGSVVTANR